MQLAPAQQELLLNLARLSIRAALDGQPPPNVPPTADPALTSRAGCFVSLHELRTHRLRGCVGRIQSDVALIQAVRDCSVSVLSDPRFANMPISQRELPNLDLEISVLSPLIQADDPLDFEPLEDGIYLYCCGRSGTFLPQVARQTGWTRQQLLARLCTEKMGLPAESWQNAETTKLMKYKTLVIGPVPFLAPCSPDTLSAAPPRTADVGFGKGNVFKV